MVVEVTVFSVIPLMVQMRRRCVVQYSVYMMQECRFPVSSWLIPAKPHCRLSSVFITGTHRDGAELPAEDGPGEDRLPPVRLPHRPLEMVRLLRRD